MLSLNAKNTPLLNNRNILKTILKYSRKVYRPIYCIQCNHSYYDGEYCVSFLYYVICSKKRNNLFILLSYNSCHNSTKLCVLPIYKYVCHCKNCAEKAIFSPLRFLGIESHEKSVMIYAIKISYCTLFSAHTSFTHNVFSIKSVF